MEITQAAIGPSVIGMPQTRFALITSKVEELGDYPQHQKWAIGKVIQQAKGAMV